MPKQFNGEFHLPRKFPFMSTNRLIKTMFGHAIFIAGIAYLFLLNIYECGGVLHNNIKSIHELFFFFLFFFFLCQ